MPRRPQLQIHTRLPEALHEQMAALAEEQAMSLNAAINQACAMWAGWVQGAGYQPAGRQQHEQTAAQT